MDEILKLSEKDKKKFQEQADKVDPKDADKKVDEIKTKFGRKLEKLEEWVKKNPHVPDFIATLISNVKYLYEMLCNENYKIDWKTKALIISALGYFISPIDVIPDAIPVVGYLDDALYVAWVVHQLGDEITKYKQFIGSK